MISNSRFWPVLLFVAIVVVPTAIYACCPNVDVLQSGLSCSNPNLKPPCAKQYSTRGCNINDQGDYHCMDFQNNCCQLVNYPDAQETTPCGPHCGGHPCSPTAKLRQSRTGKGEVILADNVLDCSASTGASRDK